MWRSGVQGSVAGVASIEATFGGRNALDNFCNSPGAVVVGTSQFLHPGWIHPHIACPCAGCAFAAVDIGPPTSGVRAPKAGSIGSGTTVGC